MKKQLLFGAILAVFLFLVLAAPASATSPMEVSGTYGVTDVYGIPDLQQAGKNCIITIDAAYPFEGDLVGTATAHFRVVSHGPCEGNMPFSYKESLHGAGTFTGDVLGRSGTFDFTYEGRGWPADLGEEALAVKIVILSGTGELENLHGMLDVSYVMGDSFDTYSGQVHFDPAGD